MKWDITKKYEMICPNIWEMGNIWDIYVISYFFPIHGIDCDFFWGYEMSPITNIIPKETQHWESMGISMGISMNSPLKTTVIPSPKNSSPKICSNSWWFFEAFYPLHPPGFLGL